MTVRQAQTRAMSFFPSEKPIGATPQTPVYAILPPYNFDKGFAFCLPARALGAEAASATGWATGMPMKEYKLCGIISHAAKV